MEILASRRELNPTDDWPLCGRGKMPSEAIWLKNDI
jgi:hypothetical protein